MLTVFLSDVHLDPRRTDITEHFLAFIDNLPPQCERVFIVGDLFEAWIGDDAPGEFGIQIMQSLAALTKRGIRGFFTHGNRDFLIGSAFADITGFRLMGDAEIIDCYGQNVLLMHGDSLCTDDVEYQKLRMMVRNPQWQQQVLQRSVEERLELAQQMRAASAEQMSYKDEYIMDVNQSAVDAAMSAHDVTYLLHGHTHRPNVHRYTADGTERTRLVLGDWYEQGSVIYWSAQGYELKQLPSGTAT